MPQLLVCWVLAVLWRSQHMCLFCECRDVLWVNVTNIGAVLQEWWLIQWGEFINEKLEHIIVLTKYVLISSSSSNYAITIHYRSQALFTLPLHYVSTMPFIPFDNWGGGWICVNSTWGMGQRPHLNNSISLWKKICIILKIICSIAVSSN